MNQELTNPFNPVTPMRTFDEIRISLASPERILEWSRGEITKPETIIFSGTRWGTSDAIRSVMRL